MGEPLPGPPKVDEGPFATPSLQSAPSAMMCYSTGSTLPLIPSIPDSSFHFSKDALLLNKEELTSPEEMAEKAQLYWFRLAPYVPNCVREEIITAVASVVDPPTSSPTLRRGLECRSAAVKLLTESSTPPSLLQLSRSLPQYAEATKAVIMITDVSGFTALTEQVSALGPAGAEVMSTCLNSYFESVINLITSYGGDVIKFAGDSMIVSFEEDLYKGNSMESQLIKGLECAWRLAEEYGAMQMMPDGHVIPIDSKAEDALSVKGLSRQSTISLMSEPSSPALTSTGSMTVSQSGPSGVSVSSSDIRKRTKEAQDRAIAELAQFASQFTFRPPELRNTPRTPVSARSLGVLDEEPVSESENQAEDLGHAQLNVQDAREKGSASSPGSFMSLVMKGDRWGRLKQTSPVASLRSIGGSISQMTRLASVGEKVAKIDGLSMPSSRGGVLTGQSDTGNVTSFDTTTAAATTNTTNSTRPAVDERTLSTSTISPSSMALSISVRPRLSLKVMLAAGSMYEFHIGGPDEQSASDMRKNHFQEFPRWEFFVGDLPHASDGHRQPMAQLTEIEKYAIPGTVVVSKEVLEFLPPIDTEYGFIESLSMEGDAYRMTASPSEDGLVAKHTTADEVYAQREKEELRILRASPPQVQWGGIQSLRLHIPDSAVPWIEAGQSTALNELRIVTSVFFGFPSFKDPLLDTSSTAGCTEPLKAAARIVQNAMLKYDGSLLQMRCDEKGYLAVCAFGLPGHLHEDFAVKGVRAAFDVINSMNELKERCCAGVTTGQLFTISVGSSKRTEYTLLGNSINLAARLMVQASHRKDGNVLCDDLTRRLVEDAAYVPIQKAIEFKKIEPLVIKGRRQKVPAFVAVMSNPAFNSSGPIELINQPRGGPGGLARTDGRGRYPFIGRTDELTMIQSAIQDMLSGKKGSAILLSGLPGMGKTRILEELQKREFGGLKAHCNVFVATCRQEKRSEMWHPWRRILHSLLTKERIAAMCYNLGISDEDDEDAEGDGGLFDRLRAKVPNFQDIQPMVQDALGIFTSTDMASIALDTDAAKKPLEPTLSTEIKMTKDPSSCLHSIIDLLLAILREFAVLRGPIVLLLEDIHYMDSASWALFTAVGEHLTKEGLLTAVATFRPHFANLEPLKGSTSSALLKEVVRRNHRRLASLPTTVNHELPPFTVQESQVVMENTLRTKLPPVVLNFLYERGGGVPEYMVQMADFMQQHVQEQMQADSDGFSHSNESETLLSNNKIQGIELAMNGMQHIRSTVALHKVVTGRVDKLPPNLAAVIRAASIMGATVYFDLLLSLLKSVSEPPAPTREAVLTDLEALVEAGFLKPDLDEPQVWSFSQGELVRDIVVDSIPFELRRNLHYALAKSLEEGIGQGTYLGQEGGVPARVLGYHYGMSCYWNAEAKYPERAMKAVNFWELASEQALQAGGPAEAVAQLQRADMLASRLANAFSRSLLDGSFFTPVGMVLPVAPRVRRVRWKRMSAALCIAAELSSESLSQAQLHCLTALKFLGIPMPNEARSKKQRSPLIFKRLWWALADTFSACTQSCSEAAVRAENEVPVEKMVGTSFSTGEKSDSVQPDTDSESFSSSLQGGRISSQWLMATPYQKDECSFYNECDRGRMVEEASFMAPYTKSEIEECRLILEILTAVLLVPRIRDMEGIKYVMFVCKQLQGGVVRRSSPFHRVYSHCRVALHCPKRCKHTCARLEPLKEINIKNAGTVE